jgi:Uma2 family endonuclease
MSALVEETYYSPDEYLALERAAEEKSEYLDGIIYLMSGGTVEHSTISLNIGSELRAQLKGKRCRAFESNMKIGIPDSRLFSYPDASVVCGEPVFRDQYRDVIINPTVIVEVLSSSTERFDRGKKFARYQQLESFTDYVLIAQDEPRVEHFAKQANGTWILTIVEGLENQLHLPSLDCVLSRNEIYDRVKFPKEEGKRKKRSPAKGKLPKRRKP